MIDFPIFKIGELIKSGEAEIQTGPFGTQLKASDYSDHGYPVINVRNVGFGDIRTESLEFIDDRIAEKLPTHRLMQNDIVFGRKGAVERHGLITETQEGWYQGSDCLRLRFNSPRVSPKFISYFFRTQAHQDWMMAVCAFGATMASLNQDIVKLINIPVPPIDIQNKIAGLLSAYGDLIENNKRRITLLENMAEEIYREWFVRFRFPGWREAEFEKGSPKGWKYRKFRDLVTHYIGGGWGEDEQSAVFSEGAYVIRGTDIPKLSSGDFSPRIFRFHKPSNLKSRIMQEHDFVFEASGGSKDQLLGRNLMLTRGMLSVFGDEVMCASFCKHIRFDKEKTSPFFMKYFLKLFYEQDLVGIYQVQSTGISNYQFESFLDNQHVLVPDESILKSFDKVVKPIIAQLDNLSLANLKLEQTRSQLLPRLISGKLSVENLDIQFPPSMQSDQSDSADEAAA